MELFMDVFLLLISVLRRLAVSLRTPTQHTLATRKISGEVQFIPTQNNSYRHGNVGFCKLFPACWLTTKQHLFGSRFLLKIVAPIFLFLSFPCFAQDCDPNDWTQLLHAEEAGLLKEIDKYRIRGYDMSQLYTVDEDNPNRHMWLDPQYKDAYNPAVGSYWYDVPAYRLCVRLHGLDCGPNGVLLAGKFGVNFMCQGRYHAALPQENTTPSCNSAPSTAGNPITLATGEKIQSEHLMLEGLPVNYVFESSKTGSSAQWQQTPDEIRLDKTIAISDRSLDFYNEESACEEGLAELKTRNPGLLGLTAEYACSTCFLKKDGQVVSALGIGTKTKINGLVQHKRQNGSLTNYFLSCAGQFQPTLGSSIQQSLVRDGNDWQLISSNGKKTFNQNGKIAAIHSPSGQLKNRYTYTPEGELTSVQNEQGQQFNYNFTNGQLNSIQAPNGKTLQFGYTGTLLTRVTHPDQTTRTYHYEDPRFPNNLTGITDERGIRYATWKYDDLGRAISSEHAGGAEKTSLFFNPDGSTTVTNALGKKPPTPSPTS
jgi:YD repeat-containing protein